MFIQIFCSLVLFIALIFFVMKCGFFHPKGISPVTSIILFLAKCAGGFAMGFYYLNYAAGGDTLLFFKQSQLVTDLLFHDPVSYFKVLTGLGDQTKLSVFYESLMGWYTNDSLFNDSRTVIRLSSIFGIFSFGNYYFNVICFSFLAFTGTMGLYRFFSMNIERNFSILIAVVFLIPSCLFWTSGLGKEALALFALGMLLELVNRSLFEGLNKSRVTLIIVILYFFILIKIFLLLLLLPAIIAYVILNKSSRYNALTVFAICHFVFFVLMIFAGSVNPELDATELIYKKRYDFEAFSKTVPADTKSYLNLPEFTPDYKSIITATPAAFFTTLIHPWFSDAKKTESWMQLIENIVIISIILFSFLKIKRVNELLNKSVLIFCISYVITNFVLIGLTSPVLGAMVRYKALILPFLLMIPLIIISHSGQQNKIDTFEKQAT